MNETSSIAACGAITTEDIDQLITNWGGTLVSIEKMDGHSYNVTVTDIGKATELIDYVRDLTLNNFKLKAELASVDSEG